MTKQELIEMRLSNGFTALERVATGAHKGDGITILTRSMSGLETRTIEARMEDGRTVQICFTVDQETGEPSTARALYAALPITSYRTDCPI